MNWSTLLCFYMTFTIKLLCPWLINNNHYTANQNLKSTQKKVVLSNKKTSGNKKGPKRKQEIHEETKNHQDTKIRNKKTLGNKYFSSKKQITRRNEKSLWNNKFVSESQALVTKKQKISLRNKNWKQKTFKKQEWETRIYWGTRIRNKKFI